MSVEETKLQELMDGQAKLWEEYKKTVDKSLENATKAANELPAEVKLKIEKMEAKFSEYETEIKITKENIETEKKAREDAEKKLADFEAKLNRPSGSVNKSLERKDFVTQGLYEEAIHADAEAKALATWKAIRGGNLTDEEKVMTLRDPETGGYLAPPEVINEIIKEMREVTPVLSIAKVRTTSANSIVIPRKTGTITAARRGESESKSETTGLKYGSEQMTLPEMYAYLDVSEQDLEDSMFNLEAEIREEFNDAFAAKLGAEFITGTGPLQLEGLLTNANISSTSSGSNSALQPDQLIAFVEAALKQQYKVKASLMFNQNTLAAIRQLKDAGNHYIWMPGQFQGAMVSGAPSTVCGKPYIISEDMPDIAQNAYPIVYGDFKKGYTVGMRVRLGIKRIVDSTLDAAGNVRFSGRMRVGGAVVLAAAIKKHKIST